MSVKRFVPALARAVALVATIAVFAAGALSLLPGDRARLLAGPQASAHDVERLRQALELDAPWTVRTKAAVARAVHRSPQPGASADAHESCVAAGPLHLDLGMSQVFRAPVARLLRARLFPSLALAVGATLATVATALALGYLAARSARLRAIVTAGRVVSAIPAFSIGLALHEVFARRLDWLPLETSLSGAGSAVVSFVLPMATLALAMVGPYAALAESHFAELKHAPFVQAAVARGRGPAGALWVHGHRLVLGRLATMACLDAGLLVGGSVLTERLFRFPGLGSLAVDALLGRDLPLLVGVAMLGAAAVAFASAVAEGLRGFFGPRATPTAR